MGSSEVPVVMRDFSRSFIITALFYALLQATFTFAALSCSVTTAAACISPSVIVLRMSAVSNAHSELPSQSNTAYASNVVCCSGVSGLGNSCSGVFATVLQLAAVTNSHVQQNTQSGYTNNACLSVSAGTVGVGYQASNCTGFDTTLASMSAATNAHVGDGNTYATKICATATASSLTFTTDSSSENFPSLAPGAVVATTSILTVTTGNTTGFNITASRSNAAATLLLNTDSTISIPDKTNWVAPVATTTAGNATASTTEALTLQFRVRQANTDTANYASSWWGGDDTTASALFAGFPTTAQSIINRSTAAGAGTVAYVLYNLNVPATQKTGTYSGGMTYTATANP